MSESDSLQPPKETIGDKAHAVVRGGLGVIPYGGTAAIEIFNAIIAPPIERRRGKWREEIANRLQALEQSGGPSIADLSENETFVTTMLQATQAAIRNHTTEKHEALRNAVLNAAATDSPDESIQQVFINLIDQFTVWHLRLLKLLQNPPQWFVDQGRQPPQYALTSSIARLVGDAYPEIGRDFYDLLFDDLKAGGVCTVSRENTHTNMSASGAFEKRTTQLGDRFLAFIAEPPSTDEVS